MRFEVEIKLTPTAQGGRVTPVASGYRSLLRFADSAEVYGYELELRDPVQPGASATGSMFVWFLDSDPGASEFVMLEGDHAVGWGRVLSRPAARPARRTPYQV